MGSKIIEFIGIIFTIQFVLGIHELGHLVTGLIQGFQFELFVVGPLGIKREDNKIKVYLNKNLAYYGGVAAVLPVDDNPKNIKKFANVILAGPLSSLVLSIICLIFTCFFNFSGELFMFMAGFTSFGIFLATTIPSKTGTFFSDRKRYQRLISKGKERETEIALLRIIGIYGRDNSYKNVNIDDINLVIQDTHYQYFGIFCKLSFQHETTGSFDIKTKANFDELTFTMPKSFVKVIAKELDKLIQVAN
ncbi:hypothetical protein LPB136_12020 [Tenacibaculum todarodis]|uniref:Peptidase M50 domain-containing protein n=1 Tax=Tenacibaculum todarodis TaxID=1850252 RepID=A0A1L3JLS9_9FLAO|nr:M50 family metallopeptidase [Tenacibaculum todarodis]APG66049.1 hypothetical protein LPB136_12020 [Tenacibaculum todarodis]